MSELKQHFILDLEPTSGQGGRFQPTGFPNLGAALFERPKKAGGWEQALQVESPQSIANRLEATTWDEASNSQRTEFDAIPYVEIVDTDGLFLTSSRLEAHRLACAYIMDSAIEGHSGREWLQARLGLHKGHALDQQALAAAVFELDPLSLIHGVFFAQKPWPWQPKIARAVTSFIEASDVRAAVSGGVKKDSVDIAGGATNLGYGMVPFQRIEYTARNIQAFVSVDREQLRSYGLGEARTELLEAIIEFELTHFFRRESIRLRTACELRLSDKAAETLPTLAEADTRLSSALSALEGQLGQRTVAQWSERSAKKGE